jgi:hypothetical protein
LAASARALADAYGLVGANVLIATGNFEAFNEMLANNMGFDTELAFYRRKKYDGINAFADNTKNSIYSFSDLDMEYGGIIDNRIGIGDTLVGESFHTKGERINEYGDAEIFYTPNTTSYTEAARL